MSVPFGLFYKDGCPVAHELDAMYSGMKHFPHDAHAFTIQGKCGFGHTFTCNTPEALHESMPRWIESARLLLAAEGRIDNRGELFDALAIRPTERAEMPDEMFLAIRIDGFFAP